MTLRSLVENFLVKTPMFRERIHKDRGIAHLLIEKPEYSVLKGIRKEVLTRFVQDYTSMDRSWRQILQERPELRGKDYEEKDMKVNSKRLELGYSVKKS